MPRRPTVKTYPKTVSIGRYEHHLRGLLDDEETKTEFLNLASAKHIGCFCEPHQLCHVDTILRLLRELTEETPSQFPQRQCLKVKYLRPRWRDLKEYNARPAENVAAVRSGRVFRVSRRGEKKRYAYPASRWCNPFRVK